MKTLFDIWVEDIMKQRENILKHSDSWIDRETGNICCPGHVIYVRWQDKRIEEVKQYPYWVPVNNLDKEGNPHSGWPYNQTLWIQENIEGQYTEVSIDQRNKKPMHGYSHYYYAFENEEDAVAFKLRWW